MLTIYDNQGKVVYSAIFRSSERKIPLNFSANAEGIYTAVLANGERIYTGRIVVAGK